MREVTLDGPAAPLSTRAADTAVAVLDVARGFTGIEDGERGLLVGLRAGFLGLSRGGYVAALFWGREHCGQPE